MDWAKEVSMIGQTTRNNADNNNPHSTYCRHGVKLGTYNRAYGYENSKESCGQCQYENAIAEKLDSIEKMLKKISPCTLEVDE